MINGALLDSDGNPLQAYARAGEELVRVELVVYPGGKVVAVQADTQPAYVAPVLPPDAPEVREHQQGPGHAPINADDFT